VTHIPLIILTTQGGETVRAIDLRALTVDRPLPHSLRIVLENVARQVLADEAAATALTPLTGWRPGGGEITVPMRASRVILPDSSGLPALMDLAAARDAAVARGLPPGTIEPSVPVTLVVDHSLIVDRAGHPNAQAFNIEAEYRRNAERYSFFKWAAQAFERLSIVPPGAGIIHQVHLERLARLVETVALPGHGRITGPEFVLGCDSHTPMVGGLGLLAWGVGGIDGEAAMLGAPYLLRLPRVVGVRLTGRLPAGATTTDLVLTVTERLRQVGVVGAFVEFCGPGLAELTVPDRATLANMAPEYGATVGHFPIDAQTIAYLHQSGREADHIALIEAHARATGLFVEDHAAIPDFCDLVEIDLAETAPSVAGPRRPQDRVALPALADSFRAALGQPRDKGGFGLDAAAQARHLTVDLGAETAGLTHGAIAIAAITSCTNTSNPSVMLAAGLLARNARVRGLRVPGWVKTSMAPGSRLVSDYLAAEGLMAPLEELGFHVVGYGCTTCSGKSGPVAPAMEAAGNDLVLASVLSGNRNFEGRIHKSCRANYLASPPLVVAFALAGRVDVDFETEPLGTDAQGAPVYLREIWPDSGELEQLVRHSQRPERFAQSYATLYDGSEQWRALPAPEGPTFAWDPASTYIRRPPFFDLPPPVAGDRLEGLRVLVRCGDSLTTDHITPSGEILPDSLAGRYLVEQGVAPEAFNAVTQRRGNHEFMARVTFANQRLQNLLASDQEGGLTRRSPDGPVETIHEAATAWGREGVPLMVLAGRDYGMGSSRDWAAKGPRLLGVRVVLAESFERIHRANLIGMGILPLVFAPGDSADTLGLTGFESYDISGLEAALAEGAPVPVRAGEIAFTATLDTGSPQERALLRDGGVFHRLLKRIEEGTA